MYVLLKNHIFITVVPRLSALCSHINYCVLSTDMLLKVLDFSQIRHHFITFALVTIIKFQPVMDRQKDNIIFFFKLNFTFRELLPVEPVIGVSGVWIGVVTAEIIACLEVEVGS